MEIGNHGAKTSLAVCTERGTRERRRGQNEWVDRPSIDSPHRPALPPMSDAVPSVFLSVPRPFVYSLIHAGSLSRLALFAQWGISCVWAVGYRRSTGLPPSPSAGDGGAAALLGYTDRNAEQGNSILRVHLGRQR